MIDSHIVDRRFARLGDLKRMWSNVSPNLSQAISVWSLFCLCLEQNHLESIISEVLAYIFVEEPLFIIQCVDGRLSVPLTLSTFFEKPFPANQRVEEATMLVFGATMMLGIYIYINEKRLRNGTLDNSAAHETCIPGANAKVYMDSVSTTNAPGMYPPVEAVEHLAHLFQILLNLVGIKEFELVDVIRETILKIDSLITCSCWTPFSAVHPLLRSTLTLRTARCLRECIHFDPTHYFDTQKALNEKHRRHLSPSEFGRLKDVFFDFRHDQLQEVSLGFIQHVLAEEKRLTGEATPTNSFCSARQHHQVKYKDAINYDDKCKIITSELTYHLHIALQIVIVWLCSDTRRKDFFQFLEGSASSIISVDALDARSSSVTQSDVFMRSNFMCRSRRLQYVYEIYDFFGSKNFVGRERGEHLQMRVIMVGYILLKKDSFWKIVNHCQQSELVLCVIACYRKIRSLFSHARKKLFANSQEKRTNTNTPYILVRE